MSQALRSLETGLLTVACSPTQKIVVAIPTFQEYSPGPASILFLSLSADPFPTLNPVPWSLLCVAILTTLGSIWSSAFSGNFIAYFAISVVLPERDWAETWDPKMPIRPAHKMNRNTEPNEGARLISELPSVFAKFISSIQ